MVVGCKGKEMKSMNLSESETIETTRVVSFPDGPVTITESEVHEFYGPDLATTRLVISDAIDRTRTYIAKARDEFAELNSVMRELVPR